MNKTWMLRIIHFYDEPDDSNQFSDIYLFASKDLCMMQLKKLAIIDIHPFYQTYQ